MSASRRALKAGARPAPRGRALGGRGLRSPAAEFWGAALPTLLDSVAENRRQRLHSGVRFQQSRLERRVAGLRSFNQELAEETSEAAGNPPTPVEDPYGTGVNGETQVPIPSEAGAVPSPAPGPQPAPVSEPTPAPTPLPTPTPAPPPAPSAAAPSSRSLYEVFDRLDPGEFTDDYYPKVSVVNSELEEEGEPRSDRDVIRPVFDRWLHDRIEEGRLSAPKSTGAPGSSSPKPLTDKVLFAAFDNLDSNDFTADEPKYPLVKSVEDHLPKGYEKATKSVVHSAYDRYPSKKPS